jgi:hypothetical protein
MFRALILPLLASFSLAAGAVQADERYASSDVYMRDGPGPGHKLILKIPSGSEMLSVSECRTPDGTSDCNEWCRISWGDQSGWAASCGLRVDECSGGHAPLRRRYGETTRSRGDGSCPYLYAWSEQDAKWQNYGTVIINALGKQRKTTDVVKLSSLAAKFRLSEEEPEESFIENVELRIETKDGSGVTLKPSPNNSQQFSEQLYLHIRPFRAVEFSFKLPSWIEASNVTEASLSITGYYEKVPPQSIWRRRYVVSRAIVQPTNPPR